MSEERIDVTINIRKEVYDKLNRAAQKFLYVPSAENLIINLIDDWDNREQNV